MSNFYIDLFEQFRKYDTKHASFRRGPHLCLFCDGSGSMQMTDGTEMFTFHNLDHLMEKLKQDNATTTPTPVARYE